MPSLDVRLLNTETLSCVAPLVRQELQRITRRGTLSTSKPLEQVFRAIFGADRTREEFVSFMVFASPIARHVTIDLADIEGRVGITIDLPNVLQGEIIVADVKTWLAYMEAVDPPIAMAIDLHYFAGFTIRQTAAALHLPPQDVIRDLRLAKLSLIYQSVERCLRITLGQFD